MKLFQAKPAAAGLGDSSIKSRGILVAWQHNQAQWPLARKSGRLGGGAGKPARAARHCALRYSKGHMSLKQPLGGGGWHRVAQRRHDSVIGLS